MSRVRGSGPVAGAGRRRALQQLLGLVLAGVGYCLLLAATALQPQPKAQLEQRALEAMAAAAPGPAGGRSPANSSAPASAPAAEPPAPAQQEQQQQQEAAAAAREREQQEYEGDVEDDLEALEEELEARRRSVWATCEASGLGRSGQPNAWEFFIDSRHGLVWCNVFKAASTAWMYNFNLLAGYKASFLRRSLKQPLVLARARFPRPNPEQLLAALPDCLSFLIVREPFERLLSAYRNKLEGLRTRYYGKVGREIAKRYPTPAAPSASNGTIAALAPAPAKGPTFSQFVQYVIQTGLLSQPPRFDEHWAPYYRFCTPCHVNFTVIAKVETLERDQRYIIRRAGLEAVLPGHGADGQTGASEKVAAPFGRQKASAGMFIPPQRLANRGRGGRPTAALVRAYYGQLTRTQLRQLLKIYGTDFDMFGYNYTKYYDMVQPDPPASAPAVVLA